MTVLRCERLASGDVDAAIASLGAVTLARTPIGAFVDVDDNLVDRARRVLAFAGVRAGVSVETLAPRAGTRAAIGRDLTPLPLPSLALDLVHVLRPVVFDIAAIGAPPERRALTREGALARWLFFA
jgi:hypothetical protein